jgi:hypothetical protein
MSRYDSRQLLPSDFDKLKMPEIKKEETEPVREEIVNTKACEQLAKQFESLKTPPRRGPGPNTGEDRQSDDQQLLVEKKSLNPNRNVV